MTKYKIVKQFAEHEQLQHSITDHAWPEFMRHDKVANRNWDKLFSLFDEYQFTLMQNEEVLGLANSIPFRWQKTFDELPDEGWDWVFQKGVNDRIDNITPNVLNGLQIVVNPKFQGKGISGVILQEMIKLAQAKGFQYVTIPVRPSHKSKYPETSIDEYIEWRRDDYLPFDPWLRVHVRMGGRIIKPCQQAMYISGSIAQWQLWTDIRFPKSGNYNIEGALTPVKIDLENDIGEYVEPNVWVLHKT